MVFDKVKQLYELKRQADKIKAELAAEILEVDRGDIKIVISADMKIHEMGYPKDTEAKELTESINKAIEEAQKVAAKKMQGQMTQLGDLLR